MRILSLLTPVFLALSALIVVWDILLAGQIAQLRKAPRSFRTLTALVGLLIAPGLVVELASGSLITGRTIVLVTWLWPMVLVLFAAQAVYAVARRLVAPLIGLPIALYDLLAAGAGLVRYAGSLGADVPPPLLALTAAQASALGLVTGAAALASPFALQIPILAPAYPARWRWSGGVRATLAFVAGVSAALVLVEIPPSMRGVASYSRYSSQLIQEHPAGDFAVGLKIFPDLDGPPPSIALRSDLQLVDTTGVDAVLVVVDPGGARAAALDSVAHSLDQLRRDSTLLIVALGYGGDDGIRMQRSRAQYFASRLADVRRIAQRLRPDYLLPADEPYGRGARLLGALPPEIWIDYYTRAAVAAHRVDRRIRVGVAASSYGGRDSALYVWAASPDSPIDVLGFTIFPSFRGGFALESRTRAADRWMRATRTPLKEHWVFAAGGYPAAHGERSQELAIWGALAWATSRPAIRGLVVSDAGDYDAITGLRAPGGRVRPAGWAVLRATRGLQEAAAATAPASQQ